MEIETQRLVDRLFNTPDRRVVNFNVWWGPDAHLLTAEERAGVLNRALDDPGEPIEDIDD